ncbi:MAG: LacI family DNA-binding transcriptional regulator [Anaerolineae bacterium]|nr:LacI family DNA-binding transcriptional regulator [Anaerolineae bacterium]MDW8171195.1 LacI family DNA-binding transcriptional regulator [Anaerolineae bacterium]
MQKKVTSVEVAARAGVSQSTVSRVFSGISVSEAARQRVLAAAQELGYQPNAIARMMSTRQTNIVGLVMATITSPFYPYVLEKFLRELQAIDKQVLLFTASEAQSIDDILPLALRYQVDALIVTSVTLSSELAAISAQRGTPIVLFNRSVSDPHISAVCSDNLLGAAMAADALLDTGHARLAWVAGLADTSTNQERERGFSQRLQARGVATWRRAQGRYTYESGYQAACELLDDPQPPDGIFCANDIMALGAIDAIRTRGLVVGQDVSVIGFDNIPMAAWGAYQLTTISQEVDEMIRRTLAIMQEKIEDPASPSRVERVAGRLIVRTSVRGLSSC